MSKSQANTLPSGANQIAPGTPEKNNGTAVVWVGCKLPHGLIMEFGKFGDEDYRQIRLEGSNATQIIGGYGLTAVAKDLWDNWLSTHKHLTYVRKGFVFEHSSRASAESHAKDMRDHKNGFEPLDPTQGMTSRDPDGRPITVEGDMDHLNNGRRELARMGVGGR